MKNPPNSEKGKKAYEELNKVLEAKRRKTPQNRHEKRISALYVEPNLFGNQWNRPDEISKEETHEFLINAINDYSSRYDQVIRKNCKVTDPQLYQALENWKSFPNFWAPKWPDP